jgi:hypothetical protein
MSLIDELENQRDLIKTFCNEIDKDEELHAFVKKRVGTEIYGFVSELVAQPPKIALIIDGITPKFDKALNALKRLADTEVVEFRTFVRENAENVRAHLFEPILNIYPEPAPSSKAKPSLPSTNHETHSDVQIGNSVEMELIFPSERKYAAFHLDKNVREFFPGYKVEFMLDTDIGELKTSVTNATSNTEKGDPIAGRYIRGGLFSWFKKHPEADIGAKVRFECIEPFKRYRLYIV